jgi:hypothetical protein
VRTITVHKKFLWLIPYSYQVERPHIQRCSPSGKIAPRYWRTQRCYSCEGAGQIGFGITPLEAWDDWAMWALI